MEVSEDVGVSLGGLDLQNRSGGVGYKITYLDGWWTPTVSSGGLEPRGGTDGSNPSEAFAQGRRLVARGSIRAHTHLDAARMLRALWAELPVRGAAPFVVTEDGQPFYAMIRQEDRPGVEWVTDKLVTFDFQAHSREHRLLGGTQPGPQYSVSVGLPYTVGGRVRPYTLPAAINATTVSGSVEIDSSGDATAPVWVTFSGPVSRPGFHTPDGQRIQADFDLLAGQTLVLDLDNETALLNGVTRRGAMRGDWPSLPPGRSTLIFDSAAYDAAARMTVSWSQARK